MNLASVSSVVCALLYAGLAALLVLHSARRPIVMCLVGACAVTALWAFAEAGEAAVGGAPPAALRPTLDTLRSLSWLAFLGVAYRSGSPERSRRALAGWFATAALGAALLTYPWLGESRARIPHGPLFELVGHLLLSIGALVLVEALLRRARTEGHGRSRYLCLGIGGVFAYDLLVGSQTLMLRQADPALLAVRPAVAALALPLLAAGAARNQAWATELNLARRAVVHSATLFAIGAYLLGLAAVGALLRDSGGRWGRSYEAIFLFAGGLTLAFVWASPSARSALRFQLGRYLFTHRHDYREQWERFAGALSGGDGTTPGAATALRALGDVIGSPSGALWLRDGDSFALAAAQGEPAATAGDLRAGPFTAWLEGLGGRVAQLGAADLPADAVPPALAWGWVVVPLVRGRLAGFVLLSRPRARASLHPEDAELLRVAGIHAASSLLADERARRLAEGRRFEEVSRGLAFLAHDLRNVANELTLILANARRHLANPEFQRDLLLSMEESVQSMQRLLDKVARRRQEASASDPVDFEALVRSALRARGSGATRLEYDRLGTEPLPILCDGERLASMSGHLIQNAFEAAGASGHVLVRLGRDGDDAVLEVEDDGPGMPPDILRDRLRHPFQSNKPGGFGLGLFECRQLSQELGGELVVTSVPGRGTLARLRLPLAKGPDSAREDGSHALV